MAITLKMADGDFVIGPFNEFTTIVGNELLRQHVGEAIRELMQIDNLVDLESGSNSSILEGMLSLRLFQGLQALKSIMSNGLVPRDADEQFGAVSFLAVRQNQADPRVVNFVVQVLSLSQQTVEVTGGISA